MTTPMDFIEAIPQQSYCERHMNKGHHHSGNLVEGQTPPRHDFSTAQSSTSGAYNNSSFVSSLEIEATHNTITTSSTSDTTSSMSSQTILLKFDQHSPATTNHNEVLCLPYFYVLDIMSKQREIKLSITRSNHSHSNDNLYLGKPRREKPTNKDPWIAIWPNQAK